MAKWTGAIGGSLKAGQKVRDKAGTDQALSKIVELNGKYRIFFRTFMVPDPDTGEVSADDKDIRAAVVPGRLCDYEVCGTGFIKYNEDMLDYDPDTGECIDLTNLTSWARIARVLFEASCIKEKKNAEAEAKRAAEELGKPIDQYSLNKKLEEIEVAYHGGEDAAGKAIMPSKQVAISGIKWKISTRIAVVKMNAQGAPEWKDAKYATFEIGKTKGDQLNNFLSKPEYCFADTNYLELGYDYIGADKKTAGQTAAFQGISRELSLEKKFPAEWEKYGKAFVDGIVPEGDAETIINFLKSKNVALKKSADTKSAIASIRKWCATNQAVFGSINFEDETTSRAAVDFLESHLLDELSLIKGKMEELANERKNSNAENEEGAKAEDATSAGDGKSLTDIIAEQESEQKAMQSVMEHGNVSSAEQTIRSIAGGLGDDIGLGDDLADL